MDMRRNYYEDIRLFDGPWTTSALIVLAVVLVGLPFWIPSYDMFMVNTMLVNIMIAVGLNLLVGFTGQVSLGHAGFVAIGAYGCVLLMTKVSLPFIVAVPLAALLAAGFGFLLGIPALRLEGPYLAIATMGFGLAVIQVIGRWSLFGGHMGLQVPPLDLFGWKPKGDIGLYWVLMPIVVFGVLCARNLTKTRVGRAFIAVRDSDIAARTLGVNVSWYKTLSFAVSAFYAGLAGALWAFALGYVNPGMFDFFLSILFLAMIVVGGVGSHAGAVMGAILVTWLNIKLEHVAELPIIGEALHNFSAQYMSLQGLPNIRFVIFGLIFIGVVLFEAHGLYGFWLRIKKYWRTWPF